MDHLQRYSGTIEKLGDKETNLSANTYAYIRLLTSDRAVRTLKQVVVLNSVDSYLNENAEAVLYVSEPHPKLPRVAFAVQTNGRSTFDRDELKVARRTYYLLIAQLTVQIPKAVILTFIGGLGIPWLIQIFVQMARCRRAGAALNEADIEQYLRRDGFPV